MVVHVLGIKYNYNDFVEQCNCEICPIEVISLIGEDRGMRSLLEFSSQFAENRVKLSLAPKQKFCYLKGTGWKSL